MYTHEHTWHPAGHAVQDIHPAQPEARIFSLLSCATQPLLSHLAMLGLHRSSPHVIVSAEQAAQRQRPGC